MVPIRGNDGVMRRSALIAPALLVSPLLVACGSGEHAETSRTRVGGFGAKGSSGEASPALTDYTAEERFRQSTLVRRKCLCIPVSMAVCCRLRHLRRIACRQCRKYRRQLHRVYWLMQVLKPCLLLADSILQH